MDEKLQIVQHVYGEGNRSDLQRLLEDEALRTDYEALNDVKFQLDHRKPERPDPAVIDQVMVAAAGPQGRPTRSNRRDRAARPPARRLRLMGVVSGVLAVLLVASIGLLQVREDMPLPASQEVAEESALLEADDVAAPIGGNGRQDMTTARKRKEAGQQDEDAPHRMVVDEVLPAPADAEFAESELTLAGIGGAVDTIPTWDDVDLVQLQRYLDMIEARSPESAWDESRVMSLDRLPTQLSTTPRSVNAASQRRGNN